MSNGTFHFPFPMPLAKLLPLVCRITFVGLVFLSFWGCASTDPGPLKVPLKTEGYGWWSDAPKREKTLLVFLPGRGTTGRDFEAQGFIQSIQTPYDLPDEYCAMGLMGKLGPKVDAVTVDLTFPYYQQRIATERLRADVIAPARAAGYRQIWLVGVSMGGLGAIMYDAEHPGEISGIVAIAPFLGEKPVVEEIKAASGLANWRPKLPLADDDFQRRLWLAIRDRKYGQPGRLPFVLGYGKLDRFAYGHRLLAAQLPPERVFREFGTHDWGTWRRLWRDVLLSPVNPIPRNAHPQP